MVKHLYPFLILFSFLLLLSCSDAVEQDKALEDSLQNKKKSHFVEVPEWIGIYQDTLPCADCVGILTRLDLRSDTTYKKSIVYLGKEPVFDNTFSTSGRWRYNPGDAKVWLDSAVEGRRLAFVVYGDSVLHMCDLDGKILASDRYRMGRL